MGILTGKPGVAELLKVGQILAVQLVKTRTSDDLALPLEKRMVQIEMITPKLADDFVGFLHAGDDRFSSNMIRHWESVSLAVLKKAFNVDYDLLQWQTIETSSGPKQAFEVSDLILSLNGQNVKLVVIERTEASLIQEFNNLDPDQQQTGRGQRIQFLIQERDRLAKRAGSGESAPYIVHKTEGPIYRRTRLVRADGPASEDNLVTASDTMRVATLPPTSQYEAVAGQMTVPAQTTSESLIPEEEKSAAAPPPPAPKVEKYLYDGAEYTEAELKGQGWSDEQIAALEVVATA